MEFEIDKLIKENFNDVLDLKDRWTLEKFMKNYGTDLTYSKELKELLYLETNKCLEIYNRFIVGIIKNYIKKEISFEELQSYLKCSFECKNNNKKEYFNKIFPEFINLLINNINFLDKEKNIDTENEIEEENETEEENNNEINDLELLDYDKKIEPFKFRENQEKAIKETIQQDFKSGIHCQIMGAGKTFIMLNIIYQHWLKYKQNLVYIITTDRIEILKSWFMINIKENKEKENKEYYTIKDNNITYTFNYDRFTKWTEDKIIDMNIFESIENIINKSSLPNFENLKKPLIWIVNNAYLKAGFKYKKLDFKNIGLILVDECHSVSGKQNYEMLEYLRNQNINIIGFSATPLRPVKSAEDNILKVYGLAPHDEKNNELNIISNYDMILALRDGVVLPFIHTIIKPETDKKSLKINSNNKQELTLRNIIDTYFVNNKDLPYKKGVAWVNAISKIAKDIGNYYKEIKIVCGKKIKLFVSYSGNNTYAEVNELEQFEKFEGNALLLCVNRVKEGSDIKNLDCGLFLDAVKNRSIVSSLQSIGRIMRPDKDKKKKYAYIIESIKVDEDKKVESITVKKVLNYYKKILNISSLSKQIGYIDEILKLFDETEIINEEEEKAINIIIDKEKDIKCKINLKIKQIDWSIFQEELRNNLAKKLKLDEEVILEREFIKLKHQIKGKYKTKKEYLEKSNQEKKPDVKYKNWWKGWYIFLSIDISKYPKSKEEWIKKCKELNIQDSETYNEFAEEMDLPLMPEEMYVEFTTIYNELSKKNNRR